MDDELKPCTDEELYDLHDVLASSLKGNPLLLTSEHADVAVRAVKIVRETRSENERLRAEVTLLRRANVAGGHGVPWEWAKVAEWLGAPASASLAQMKAGIDALTALRAEVARLEGVVKRAEEVDSHWETGCYNPGEYALDGLHEALKRLHEHSS